MEVLLNVDLKKRRRSDESEHLETTHLNTNGRQKLDGVQTMQISPQKRVVDKSIEDSHDDTDSHQSKRPRTMSRRLSFLPAAISVLEERITQRVIGDVFVFGNGECGELGLGEDVTSRKKPTHLDMIEGACSIAVGGLHNLVLCHDGKKIYSWGCNDQKVLARPGDETVPALVEGLDMVNVAEIAAGDSISLALTTAGKIYGWGTFRNSSGIIGFTPHQEIQEIPTRLPTEDISSDLRKERVLRLATGANHVVALTATHKVYTWGDGEQGQLGRKCASSERGLIPHTIGFKPPGKRYGSTKIRQIFCGGHHAFAVDDANYVYAWGLNNYGQLGLSDRDNRHQPTVIESLYGVRIRQMDGGEHHSMLLTEDGEVYTWGRGNYGQLGHGESEEHALVPKKVSFFVDNGIKVSDIACGDHHCLALTCNNELYCWGYGEMLQLGNGEEKDERMPCLLVSKQLEGKEILQLGAGAQHSVLLARNKI